MSQRSLAVFRHSWVAWTQPIPEPRGSRIRCMCCTKMWHGVGGRSLCGAIQLLQVYGIPGGRRDRGGYIEGNTEAWGIPMQIYVLRAATSCFGNGVYLRWCGCSGLSYHKVCLCLCEGVWGTKRKIMASGEEAGRGDVCDIPCGEAFYRTVGCNRLATGCDFSVLPDRERGHTPFHSVSSASWPVMKVWMPLHV